MGSSHGCLVIWKEDDGMMHLLNPIYGSRIQLPYYKTQVVKAVVSCDPCRSDSFVVVVLYGKLFNYRRLSFCKSGDKHGMRWNGLNGGDYDGSYSDIIFNNGPLFALSMRRNSIEVWDIRGEAHNPMITMSIFLFLGRK